MSQNLEQRLVDHNNGKSKYTKTKIPWEIVYVEECHDSEAARAREKYLKSSAGRRFIKKMIAKGNIDE